MLDAFRTTPLNYRPYILRARRLRSEAFRGLAGAILAWLRTGLQRLKCGRIQRRAERELRALNNNILKDIGVSRGGISGQVRGAFPCP